MSGAERDAADDDADGAAAQPDVETVQHEGALDLLAHAAGDSEEAARALANIAFTLTCWVRPGPALRYGEQALAYAQEHEVHILVSYAAISRSFGSTIAKLLIRQMARSMGAISFSVVRSAVLPQVKSTVPR